MRLKTLCFFSSAPPGSSCAGVDRGGGGGAAVNSLLRWSLAKRGFSMKSTGYQCFFLTRQRWQQFFFYFEAKWHLKLIPAMNTSEKHFKELTISSSAATFDKDIFGRL